MSWIKSSSLVLLCWGSFCLGDRVEFISSAQNQAELIVNPVMSREVVSPIMGDFVLPALERNTVLDGFTEISVAGLSLLGQLGRPSLPTTGKLIAVPEGYRPELTIIEKEETTLSNTWVAPYQAKTRCECDKKKLFVFDSKTYESNEAFPAQVIELQTVGALQSLNFARIAINPIQFHPKDKSISVTYRLKFKVQFIKEKNSLSHALPKTLFGLAQNMASNGKALGTSVIANSQPEKMLIVSPEILKSALRSFIQWKSQKGIAVDWVSFETAGGSKESLQKYIKNYYQSQETKPTYLLLVGNAETLPPFMEMTTTANKEQIAASDYPYTLLSGTDPIPDILYGRLLANNEEEVRVQTSRWIEYEKAPERATWYSKGTVIASNEKGSGLSDKEYVSSIASHLKKYSFREIDEFFQEDQTATTPNILKAVSEGRSWITYMGHGSGLGWLSTNDDFDVNAVNNLSNSRLPFILDISCANADYINHQTPFAKAWVTRKSGNNNAGAVAYYGGSVDISWDPPAIMAVGISKAHFEKPIHNLGGTVLAGQIYLSEQKGAGDELIDNLRWYQLLGDPSLELRTSEPTPIRVKQSVRSNGNSKTLTLSITNINNQPVAGILASLSSSNESKPLATGKTDSQGRVTLNLKNNLSMTNLLLTTSGYNIETQISRVNE